MYAITGATGQLGRLVIDHLLETVTADSIGAAVRSPDKARDLAGVVVREADHDRPETLGPAFAGVDKLSLISSADVSGRLPRHRAVIDAAAAAGVSGDTAFTMADLSAEVSYQAGRPIAYHDLLAAAYEGVLTNAGLPPALAALLADADVAAAKRALLDDGGTLLRLIGRPALRG